MVIKNPLIIFYIKNCFKLLNKTWAKAYKTIKEDSLFLLNAEFSLNPCNDSSQQNLTCFMFFFFLICTSPFYSNECGNGVLFLLEALKLLCDCQCEMSYIYIYI